MAGADSEQGTAGAYHLNSDCSLKLLEEPAIYNRTTDDLYFINSEALEFLTAIAEGGPVPAEISAVESDARAEFLDFCTEEEILLQGRDDTPRDLDLSQAPVPSLRYLLLNITERCNLRCRHCYAGDAGERSLPVESVLAVAEELQSMQGLRLMLSGGEPLLHPDFWEINDGLAEMDLRVILLTNGTLLDEAAIDRIKAQEVQVSLDGLGASHDLLRGDGSFDRSLAAIRLLGEAGKQISVATMIHSFNLEDFPALEGLVRQLGVREWSIDLPSPAGRMELNRELAVDPAAAATLLDRAFGGAIHEPFPGFACGSHLMAVTVDGGMARCGFYTGEPVGHISEGLAAGWQKIEKLPLAELDCDCEFLAECRGGCRFRAGGYIEGEQAIARDRRDRTGAPDLCQCYRYGVIENETV